MQGIGKKSIYYLKRGRGQVQGAALHPLSRLGGYVSPGIDCANISQISSIVRGYKFANTKRRTTVLLLCLALPTDSRQLNLDRYV